MAERSTFYITTPIYYPNARPHMGHVYTTVLADAVARYHRARGQETYFLTGLDENSEKVGRAAAEAGKDVTAFTDAVAESFKDLFDTLDISSNQFIRTSDQERHWPGATEMRQRLEQAGHLYKGLYEGLYCVGCEAVKTERE